LCLWFYAAVLLAFSSPADLTEAFLKILLMHVEQAVHTSLPVLALAFLSSLCAHERSLIRARYGTVGFRD